MLSVCYWSHQPSCPSSRPTAAWLPHTAVWLCPACMGRPIGSGPEATWERARRFSPSAHGSQRPSYVTCGSGPLCQQLSRSGARCASGGFSKVCGEPFLEIGFFRVQWFCFRIFPNCSALLPPSLPRLSAFVLPSFPPPWLPWPCWFAPIITRPRRRSTRCATCSDGARLRSPGGSGPALPHSASRCRGVCALRLLSLLQVGAADFAVLPSTAGGVRTSTSAPHAPLHPPGGHLCPFL
jgi:hypothetical protein